MERAARWLATIPRLADRQLKVSFARAQMHECSLGETAQALNEICQRAELAQQAAREVLTALLPVVVDPAHIERISSLRATALAGPLPAAGRLLRQSTAAGHLLDGPADDKPQTPAVGHGERPLTLGERRALARRSSRASLDRLMRDPHPMVARVVLGNPRITEDDVVLMAAHRPARPGVITEVARAWAHHARVRMAVVLNPGAPPAVSVPLLGALSRPELEQVMRAVDLPAVVRSTAHELHELRPPLGATEPPALPH